MIYVKDMREPGESFCADFPDHEACMTGAPCEYVKLVNSENIDIQSLERP